MSKIDLITTTSALKDVVRRLSKADHITIDTEFERTRTYFARLCLVQLADEEQAFAIDAMADGIDLAPLYDLLADRKTLKVFHAARQDMEIFYHLMDGDLPAPVFDTQVAAMVCGFGDSVGYDKLVGKITGQHIDKSVRFTDWSRRPLNKKQIDYALSDVTHLRDVHRKLSDKLAQSGRNAWLQEEMEILTSPETYRPDPEAVWQRIKTRSSNRRFLARVQEIAAWRERTAIARDLPRKHVLKDEVVCALAANPPGDKKALAETRGVPNGPAKGEWGSGLLQAIERANALPGEKLPKPPAKRRRQDPGPVLELLKVLLKTVAEQQDVAPKLIASVRDLEDFATGGRNGIPFIRGWRYDLFGAKAERLLAGELAIMARGSQIMLVEEEKATDPQDA